MAFKLTVAFLLCASVAVTLVCARSARQHKIVGGEQASAHEFPYQVSLQWNFNEDGKEVMHFCGGSVLNEYYVLTAAHCHTSYNPTGHIEVVTAEHDTSLFEGAEQRRLVEEFIIHEKYDGGVGPNDIAVVRVDKPFELNDKVQRIQLPKKDEQFEGDALLSGWGSVSTTEMPEYPEILRKAVLPLVDFETCFVAWDNTTVLVESNLCAGPMDGSKSGCSADSGGPLVQQTADRDSVVQIGVVSWGMIPCGTPNKPTVFARVASYVDWIEDKLRQ